MDWIRIYFLKGYRLKYAIIFCTESACKYLFLNNLFAVTKNIATNGFWHIFYCNQTLSTNTQIQYLKLTQSNFWLSCNICLTVYQTFIQQFIIGSKIQDPTSLQLFDIKQTPYTAINMRRTAPPGLERRPAYQARGNVCGSWPPRASRIKAEETAGEIRWRHQGCSLYGESRRTRLADGSGV